MASPNVQLQIQSCLEVILITIKVLLVFCLLAGTSIAQAPTANRPEEMKKLDFLVGEWRGEGWIEFGPGQRRTFSATETIQLKLDGAILMIDGLGKARIPGKQEEVTVHSAFTVVSYDNNAKVFRWRAYQAGGNLIDTEAKVGDKSLEWAFHDDRGGDSRFTIRLTEKGEWFEVGELSGDGKSWRKFFEMTLDKAK